eukprot:Partr_v1_DN26826_c0_g1_i10_m40873 putative Ribosomal protein s9
MLRVAIQRAKSMRPYATFSTSSSHASPAATKDYYKRVGATTHSPDSLPPPIGRADVAFKEDFNITKSRSPSYFTGRPALHDAFMELDTCIDRYPSVVSAAVDVGGSGSIVGTGDAGPKWISAQLLQSAWRTKITGEEYKQLVGRLNHILSIYNSTSVKDMNVAKIVEKYSLTGNLKELTSQSRQLDEWGRAFALGFRRRIRANVWVSEALVEGEGKIYVDGIDFVDYFARFRDRNKVILPMEVTDTMGRYNVWCQLETSIPGAMGPSGLFALLINIRSLIIS